LWVKIAIFQLKNAKNLTARSWFVKEKRFYFAKKQYFLFPSKKTKKDRSIDLCSYSLCTYVLYPVNFISLPLSSS
jgi:hypothetical protein